MEKVDILLATYNGEKYIESQILSILSQTYKDWRLLIHDDGSTDNSVMLVKSLAGIDSRICLIEDGIKTGGAANNFMHLLKYSDAKYVMFCDQDDIWFDNKIEAMYSKISSLRQDIPQVVYSNSYIWKPANGILGKTILTFPTNLKSFLFLNNGTQGCVAIFNKNMRDTMLRWSGDLAMHDHLLQLIGLSIGNVTYMPTAYMLYRQHDANVTGNVKVHILTKATISQNRNIPVVSRAHYDVISHFLELYKKQLDVESLKCLSIYLQLAKANMVNRIFMILRYRFKLYDSIILLIVKLIVRPYL